MRKLVTSSAIIAILLSGQFGLTEKKPESAEDLGAELRQAPSKALFRRNPYAGKPDAVLAGKKLYHRHCTSCHGQDARGRDKAPNLHSPKIQDAPPGVLFWFLKNGNLKEGMPSWSRLPDQQRWQIVTYLQTLR